MKYSYFKKSICVLLCYFFVISVVFVPKNAYAVYEGVRNTTYSNDRCNVGTLAFDPFGVSSNDTNWEIANPVCAAYVAGTGLALMTLQVASSYACAQPQAAAIALASNASGVPLSPTMIKDRVKEATKCGALVTAQNYVQAGLCCGGMAATLIETGIAIGALGVVYAAAKGAFNNARVCGTEWQSWTKNSSDKWVKSKGQYRLALESAFAGNNSYSISNTTTSVSNIYYREFMFGGIEYIDNGGGDSCNNPWASDKAKRRRILGYDSDNQRYYMTGPGMAPVYACSRFLTRDDDEDAMRAYECCRRRSQNAICIENASMISNISIGSMHTTDYEHKFCEMGSRCNVKGIWFEIYGSENVPNYVCAKTYSVCPYNHLLGGGSEVQDNNTADTTQVNNFCQYMKHCSKLPILPYVRTSTLDGGYISSACRDMKGDSQNSYGYSAELLPINTKGFSSPMVQCFKETMENILLNKAGYTKCKDVDEAVVNDVCASGRYEFRKGYDLEGKSFFIRIQDKLQLTIRVVLGMSVTFFGVMLLFGMKAIEKDKILPYIVKIALVLYFATGDGWQYGFMKGVLGTSSFLSDLTFKVDESADNANKLDGCQFPRYNYADVNADTKYNNPQYPPGKDYLRTWDTLDCKIASALGFGPEVSVPNLVMMVVAGFFTGGLGVIFVVGSFCFAFFLIALTVRAIHIFLLSITSVVILMYVSPIMITMVLFEKTKSSFENWWKQMLGFTLQPMILFAYLGILITLFDKTVIGDVTFVGDGKESPKRIVCEGEAVDTSMYCIFRVADIQTYNGFEVLGIGIPMLASMNQTKVNSIIKTSIIMFIFMSFMDQITSFAAKLVGGAELKSDWKLSASGMAKDSMKAINNVRKRAAGLAGKASGGIARKAGESLSKGISKVTDRGKALISRAGGGAHTGGAENKAQTSGDGAKPMTGAGGHDGGYSAPDKSGGSSSGGGSSGSKTGNPGGY